MTPKEQRAYTVALERIEQCRREGKEGRTLDLLGLGLTTLPPEVGQLQALRHLSLSDNQLTDLPPELGQLQALAWLNLSDNQLTTLPSALWQFQALTRLSLDNNQLTDLPPELAELQALKQLYLHNNRVPALPPELGQLQALTQLSLNDNRLTDLPPELGKLQALKELSLHDNRLTGLPPELAELQSLTWLNLSNNHLTSLPLELRNLSQLFRLFLHENPALGLPPEVLGPTWADFQSKNAKPASPQAILDFYFSRLAQGEAPMQEVRLLMVGRGRVGKTTLLRVLRGEPADTGEKETPGITVLPLDLKCAQGTARAHTWDFGGQEFLHGTHQIFLSERCVYVLVLEGRESNWETETDYWLRFIQSFGGTSPVVVALNKYDAHAFSVDRFRLQEHCPQIVGFVETDGLTGRGIVELRGLLEQTVNRMEHVWAKVPKMWHKVKEALAGTRENYLEYRDYQKLCAREGVVKESEQASLAETLHRLGIALNFRDHHRLQHTSVLKPQWVTAAIYGLLRYVQSCECHGVLKREMVAEALQEMTEASRKQLGFFKRLFGTAVTVMEYPPDKHPFVLELMEKFEVAFPLEPANAATGRSKGPERWLIPELLREDQPAKFGEFRGAGVKRLRFSYPDALPPGLLPRFIVRTHELSEAHPDWRWRSGVVLEWGGCRALVRLDRTQRRTTVEVIDSPDEERQSLFDLIRAHLTVLHGKVQVVEEVQALEDPEKWVEMADLRLAERDRDENIKVVVGAGTEKKRVHVPVEKTLNDVESPEAREAEGPDAPRRMRLFVSYAHDDERRIKPLMTHLTILGTRGYIQAWNDKQLLAGEQWKERIVTELGAADLVLLIYSSASRASKFIQGTEGPLAVELAEKKGCAVIVVPLDRKDWDETVPLEKALKALQTATWNAKPILDFRPPSRGWLEVEHAIRAAVLARREGRA